MRPGRGKAAAADRILEVRGCHSHRQAGYAHRSRNFWSCVRYNGNNAWYANGGNGFFGNNDMYNRNQSLPVSN